MQQNIQIYDLNISACGDDPMLMALWQIFNAPLAASHIANYLLCAVMHSRRTRCSVSPAIWRLIHSDVSEISIVSSWTLTDVFHCEYQPRRWWINPFSFNLVTDSYRAPWCQSCSSSSCSLPWTQARACCWTWSRWSEMIPGNAAAKSTVVVVSD